MIRYHNETKPIAVIQKVNSNVEALTNAVYLNFAAHSIKQNKESPYIQIGNKIYPILNDSTLDENTFCMNSIQRRENSRLDILTPKLKVLTGSEMDGLHKHVSFITVRIKRVFGSKDKFYSNPEIGRDELTAQITEHLTKIKYLGNDQSYLISLTIGCDDIHCQIQTNSFASQRYTFYKTEFDIVNESPNLTIRDQNLFEFKDIREMGVGGLSKEFEEMFRRAFASRTLDPDTVQALGIKHVKGIMLYGPPGCGKTLMARQISKSMKSVDPIIVNGPELMSKYVGESEENMRKIFRAAEDEYKLSGDSSKLHVIIFDEIDSICVHRGQNSNNTGVGDRIVNQLLTKMDGVDQINNIMVIGLTNRLDLIDEAVLRPGRFEVKIEIGLPTREGRIEILDIHTDKLRKNGCLDEGIDLDTLADLTTNYTGAELEGLINSARSYALCRSIDTNDEIDKSGRSKRSKKTKTKFSNPKGELASKILVKQSDLLMAMREIQPAFGKTELLTSLEVGQSMYGVYMFSTALKEKYEKTIEKLIRFNSSRSILSLITIAGVKGSGRTTLSLDLAKQTGYPLIKFVDQTKTVGLSDYQTSSYLKDEFKKIKTSKRAVIVIDDVERLLDISERRADLGANQVLNSLLTLIDDLQKTGADSKYVVIITGLLNVIDFLTDAKRGYLDPRSITESIRIPEFPLLTSRDGTTTVIEKGYDSLESYLRTLGELQQIVCEKNLIPIKNIDIDDMFGISLGGDDEGNSNKSIPIKYYIQSFNDILYSDNRGDFE